MGVSVSALMATWYSIPQQDRKGGKKGNASGPGLASHFLIGPNAAKYLYFVMQSLPSHLQIKKEQQTIQNQLSNDNIVFLSCFHILLRTMIIKKEKSDLLSLPFNIFCFHDYDFSYISFIYLFRVLSFCYWTHPTPSRPLSAHDGN